MSKAAPCSAAPPSKPTGPPLSAAAAPCATRPPWTSPARSPTAKDWCSIPPLPSGTGCGSRLDLPSASTPSSAWPRRARRPTSTWTAAATTAWPTASSRWPGRAARSCSISCGRTKPMCSTTPAWPAPSSMPAPTAVARPASSPATARTNPPSGAMASRGTAPSWCCPSRTKPIWIWSATWSRPTPIGARRASKWIWSSGPRPMPDIGKTCSMPSSVWCRPAPKPRCSTSPAASSSATSTRCRPRTARSSWPWPGSCSATGSAPWPNRSTGASCPRWTFRTWCLPVHPINREPRPCLCRSGSWNSSTAMAASPTMAANMSSTSTPTKPPRPRGSTCWPTPSSGPWSASPEAPIRGARTPTRTA
jgi:hypothetical protein